MNAQSNGAPASLPDYVPVIVIGAGPTGMTAATLLAQQGISCLLLDRHESVYPLPRAVHADDEIYRILTRLGVGDEFAAHRRAALGLRLIDTDMKVLAELKRSTQPSANGYPQMNMFDQPELEAMLRANLKRYPQLAFRGNVEVTSVTQNRPGRVRVSFLDRVRGGEQSVEASYVLGCDGANSTVRASISAHMYGLPFQQTWAVIDVDTDAELNQWEGCHQLCSTQRAGTYMRVGETRYRWEFQLLDGETAADYQNIADIEPLIKPWLGETPAEQLRLVRVTAYTFRAQVANNWRDRNVFILGDAAHLTPPFVGQGMAAGLRDALNLSWKVAGVLGKVVARKRAGHLPAGAQSPRGGHDLDGRVDGSGDDRGWPAGRSHPQGGVPAAGNPPLARHAHQCRRRRCPRAAQIGDGGQIPHPRAAGRNAVPQPGTARWPARRSGRWEPIRAGHLLAAERCTAEGAQQPWSRRRLRRFRKRTRPLAETRPGDRRDRQARRRGHAGGPEHRGDLRRRARLLRGSRRRSRKRAPPMTSCWCSTTASRRCRRCLWTALGCAP